LKKLEVKVISGEVKHQKHAKLVRPDAGEFARNELAFLGAPCAVIMQLFEKLNALLPQFKIALVDADHHAPENEYKTSLAYKDRITSRVLEFQQNFSQFQKRALFNEQDLVLVNGNHFKAKSQVVLIDPAKPLDKKLDRLTDVKLILLRDDETKIPEYLETHFKSKNITITMGLKPIATEGYVSVLPFNQTELIATFIKDLLRANKPKLNGLVLSGGKSLRMQADKGGINYHGKSQRAYVFEQLSAICDEVFISVRDDQQTAEGLPAITDRFVDLGPYGGILSALQSNPNAAWLTVACDLPYLTEGTLNYLTANRNPSKIATAFLDSDGQFPEPLITIWEPRAYPVLLQFLSQGYSCPRKVLINTDIELLSAPAVDELRNVNHPEEREQALAYFKSVTS
jgi:molybdopterin-guanine dinucleotide biosynthesis protein A